MSPQLFYLGVTHHGAPLSIRERLWPSPHHQKAILAQLDGLAEERLLLCTCERFEIYALATTINVFAWVGRLASALPFQPNLLERHAAVFSGTQVARQLLRVSAGLESRIVGEPHILGQVRAAFADAREEGVLGPVLSALARAAIHAGKRVRRETSLGRERRSVVTVAVDHAERELGTLRGRTVVVVGTGKLAAGLVNELAPRQAETVIVVGRNHRRATSLAKRIRGAAASLEQLSAAVARADLIITCATTTSPILTRSLLEGVPHGERVVIDLGVPRNVEAACGEMPAGRVTHMDELLAGEARRHTPPAGAERIVEEELARYEKWLQERRVAPIIASYVRQARAAKPYFSLEDRRALHVRIMRVKQGVVT